jgi:hypothetical protein
MLVVPSCWSPVFASPEVLPVAPRTANPTGSEPAPTLGSPRILADMVKFSPDSRLGTRRKPRPHSTTVRLDAH